MAIMYLSMDMLYSTMEGIVPSRCRLTTRHLGATLFRLRSYQICKSHVTASMHHGTWGLMQKLFFAQLIEDSTHHIVMSRPLGATRCWSNLHDHIYKVPAHYCIMTRPLGATLIEVFMSIKQLQVPGCCKHDNPALGGYIYGVFSFEMNKPDFFKVETLIGASLKLSLCSPLKTWRLQVLCI